MVSLIFIDIPNFQITILENENVEVFHFPHIWTCFKVTIIGASPISIHMPVTFYHLTPCWQTGAKGFTPNLKIIRTLLLFRW